MSSSEKVYLQDILEAINMIRNYTKTKLKMNL